MNYSRELIQNTLDYWGPQYSSIGEKLTEEDAREILDNVIGLFDLLAELDREHNQCQKSASSE